MMLLAGSTTFASLPVMAVRVPDAPLLAAKSPAAFRAAGAPAAGAAACRAAPPPEPVALRLEPEHAETARPVPPKAAPAMRRVRNDPWRARAPKARNVLVMLFGRRR